MSVDLEFFARWRVRFGYVIAIVVLWLARPTPPSIVLGGLLGVLGLCIRGFAAGHLRKQESLTMTGPYAYTRNPLYLGSAVLALSLAIATNTWFAALLIGAYFTLFYTIVMRREEAELRSHFGAAFDNYARGVPLFFPRFSPPTGLKVDGTFSWTQYKRNHEHDATIGFAAALLLLALIYWLRSR